MAQTNLQTPRAEDGSSYNAGFFNNASAKSLDASSENRNLPSGLVPVTVRQVLEAPTTDSEDAFVINGRPTLNVHLIGQIVGVSFVSESGTHTYALDDGTGSLDVRVWFHEDADGVADYHALKRHEWRDGVYVMVFGTIRANAGKRSIAAWRMLTVRDYNWIAHHMIQVVYVHLACAHREDKAAAKVAVENGVTNAGTGQIEEEIFKACLAHDNGTGVSVDRLVEMLPRATREDVTASLEKLNQMGRAYTTIENRWSAMP